MSLDHNVDILLILDRFRELLKRGDAFLIYLNGTAPE